ncbi:hypothetical protein B0O79_1474 [Flavobacteriaceae bacterium MAR_2009_75]|nr:hypothetical protein B0O79_1474 [Flavobacteriaceae bacterium MAR_2009_75]
MLGTDTIAYGQKDEEEGNTNNRIADLFRKIALLFPQIEIDQRTDDYGNTGDGLYDPNNTVGNALGLTLGLLEFADQFVELREKVCRNKKD